MAQAQFLHEPLAKSEPVPGAAPLIASIFADRRHLREQIREDAQAAGFRIGACGEGNLLFEESARPLGDVVLIDCPQPDAAMMAALCRLDMRAAHADAQIVVSTTVEGLDDIFACLDQSAPQILVDPSRAERLIALGHVLARQTSLRLRELSEEDRVTLLRLTEQVGRIAERLDRLDRPTGSAGDPGVFRFESPAPSYNGPDGESGERLVRAARPSLPDPKLVRRIIRRRQERARFFDGDLFADPAWDILLDLTAARAEHLRVSVTSLCIASGVPPTTALRWIGQMTEAGLLERIEDDTDRRRAFIALTDRAADAMARYFAALGRDGGKVV